MYDPEGLKKWRKEPEKEFSDPENFNLYIKEVEIGITEHQPTLDPNG